MSTPTLQTTAPTMQGAARVSARIKGAVSQVFLDSTADNPHDPGELTMSGLGGCTRLAAYKIAGYAPTNTDPAERRAADLGTAIHLWMLPKLLTVLGGHWTMIEDKVTLTTPHFNLTGTLDLRTEALTFSPDTDGGETVVDAKSVSRQRFDQIKATGRIFPEHLLQVLGYCVALMQTHGVRVKYASWLYICRDTGRDEILTVPVTDDLLRLVFRRADTIADFAKDPDFAPREYRGPGLSYVCDGCAFLTRCWGPTARPGVVGAQSTAASTDDEIVDAAVRRDRARTNRLAWEKQQDFWDAVVGDRRGQFTDSSGRYTVELREQPGANRPDSAAAYRMLEALGHEIPRTRNKPSLVVTVRENAPTGEA